MELIYVIFLRFKTIGEGRKEATLLNASYAAHKLKHIFDICKEFRLCYNFICRWVLNK